MGQKDGKEGEEVLGDERERKERKGKDLRSKLMNFRAVMVKFTERGPEAAIRA